jgi:hypothetical protein
MVSVNRQGTVHAEVGEVDVDLGTVTKDEELGWEAQCALCDTLQVAGTKSAAVDLLEDHFISTHTTPNI